MGHAEITSSSKLRFYTHPKSIVLSPVHTSLNTPSSLVVLIMILTYDVNFFHSSIFLVYLFFFANFDVFLGKKTEQVPSGNSSGSWWMTVILRSHPSMIVIFNLWAPFSTPPSLQPPKKITSFLDALWSVHL